MRIRTETRRVERADIVPVTAENVEFLLSLQDGTGDGQPHTASDYLPEWMEQISRGVRLYQFRTQATAQHYRGSMSAPSAVLSEAEYDELHSETSRRFLESSGRVRTLSLSGERLFAVRGSSYAGRMHTITGLLAPAYNDASLATGEGRLAA